MKHESLITWMYCNLLNFYPSKLTNGACCYLAAIDEALTQCLHLTLNSGPTEVSLCIDCFCS